MEIVGNSRKIKAKGRMAKIKYFTIWISTYHIFISEVFNNFLSPSYHQHILWYRTLFFTLRITLFLILSFIYLLSSLYYLLFLVHLLLFYSLFSKQTTTDPAIDFRGFACIFFVVRLDTCTFMYFILFVGDVYVPSIILKLNCKAQ